MNDNWVVKHSTLSKDNVGKESIVMPFLVRVRNQRGRGPHSGVVLYPLIVLWVDSEEFQDVNAKFCKHFLKFQSSRGLSKDSDLRG